jgi:hypothetical protein
MWVYENTTDSKWEVDFFFINCYSYMLSSVWHKEHLRNFVFSKEYTFPSY